MEAKRIGTTTIHPVGIGTWAIGGDRLEDGTVYASYDRDREEAEAIRYSISRGQNHIDTAQIYGAGHCEEVVGQAIAGLDRASFFLATKVWKSHAVTSRAVERSVETSLGKLGVDQVDLIYTHAPWDGIPMGNYIEGLNRVVDRGLARLIGVSNFNISQMEQARALSDHPIVANQVHYNLVERSAASPEFLAYCRRNDVTVVAYRPVERHLLADQTEDPRLITVARRIGRPASQVAINWLIGQQGVVTIPKAIDRAHIDENLGAVEFDLSESDRRILDEPVDPDAPGLRPPTG